MLPFVNRSAELARLRSVFASADGGFACVWGRRRLGKSRLLREAVAGRQAVWCVGDERASPLQREAFAREAARVVPGFDEAQYASWDQLLSRFWREAPTGCVVVFDEFPALVQRAPELPTLLQTRIDRGLNGRSIVACGSSQRMMQGLVLDASTPLYGRAREILRVSPMAPRWLAEALAITDAEQAVRTWLVFGGVPRYWELVAQQPSLDAAVASVVLDPLGALHEEPDRLLADDMRDPGRAGSLLALIGAGATRLSEIAGRMGQPAGSLTRPLDLLVRLGLVERELPWGSNPRDTKRTSYRIADPFLAFWFRWVAPNRARLVAGQVAEVNETLWRNIHPWLGTAWESLVRWNVPRARIFGQSWLPAGRWWGKNVELDLLAANPDDPDDILVGEVKLSVTPKEVAPLLRDLERRARACPALTGRRLRLALWVLHAPPKHAQVFGPDWIVNSG